MGIPIINLLFPPSLPSLLPSFPPSSLPTRDGRGENIQVPNSPEQSQHPLLLCVEGLPPQDDELADIAAVVLVVEVEEVVADIDPSGLRVV